MQSRFRNLSRALLPALVAVAVPAALLGASVWLDRVAAFYVRHIGALPYLALVALAIIIARGKTPYRRTRIASASVACVAVLVGFVLLLMPRPPGAGEREALQAQGATFVRQLQQYHAQHERYPQAATDAGIEPPSTEYGPWTYACERNCRGFTLSLGDDTIDGFTLRWHAQEQRWRWDS